MFPNKIFSVRSFGRKLEIDEEIIDNNCEARFNIGTI